MCHWKSANFGRDQHPQLSPTQSFAYGGRTGDDVKWWKIVYMYGAHVRFDESLVNGSKLSGLLGQPLVKSRTSCHIQDGRKDLRRFKPGDGSRRQNCNNSCEARLRLGMGGIARNILTAPVAHCLGGVKSQDSG